MEDITLGNLKRTITAARDMAALERLMSFDDANPEEIEAHVTFIKEESKKRRLYELGNDLRKNAHGDGITSDRLMNNLMQSMLDIEMERERKSFETPGDFVSNHLAFIKSITPGEITGYSTSIDALDAVTGGMQNGNLIVIAARPGMCKSLLALQMAAHLSYTYDLDIPFFSLEMTKEQLGLRLVAHMAQVPHIKLRLNKITKGQWDDVNAAVERINRMPLHIDDTSGISLAEIISKTKRLKIKKGKIGPIFIDYLNKMTMGGGGTRDADITKAVGGIKDLAKDLEIPIVLLAQLNRKLEDRDDKRPLLSDLRESGSIEQEADIMIFPYRGFYYSKDDLEKRDIEVIVAKQRHGETCTIKGDVNLDTQTITSTGQNPEEDLEDVI
ncbi:MAG: replicative DNA helicase [Candidatus Thorarchaeota archaeon]|jgi:replicative DNA helicase